MSKKALQSILDQQNFWARLQDKPEMTIDTLTAEQVAGVYEGIDCGLSPEHLHCDGEISHAQAMAKYREYMGAVRELQKMGHPIPDGCYEIGE